MFDAITIEKIKVYVYALIDPKSGLPFYIGKGKGNRVFDHAQDSLNFSLDSEKLDYIRKIRSTGEEVRHVIVRHGLTEESAFRIESALIDFMRYFPNQLTNEASGHNSYKFGLMSSSEISSLYNTKPLESLEHDVVIININNTYEKAKGSLDIYSATKESWVISESRRCSLDIALSEYKGIIVEVFQIDDWYSCSTNFKNKNRWGFNGRVADSDVRDYYLNKSVKHLKKKGSANPIRYQL